MPRSAAIPVLWLCGPSGVGKTAVGWEISSRLIDAGVESAFVDIDQLGMCYPEPASDPGRYRMKERNAQAVVRNFAASGARCVVISGVVDPQRGVTKTAFEDGTLTVCKLTAGDDELRQRFLRRGTRADQVDALVGEAAIVEATTPADIAIPTDGTSVAKVATLIQERLGGWPDEQDAPRRLQTPDDDAARDVDGSILWIGGPTGVGKSTVGFAVYQKVLLRGITAAYIDVDQLGFRGPRSADHALKARNLADVWRTFRDAGAEALVVVGPVDDASADVYARTLPNATITWCRLHAGQERLAERIRLRGSGHGSWPQPGDPLKGRSDAELESVVVTAAADADMLEESSFGVRIDVDSVTLGEASDAVLAETGWLRR